MADQETTAALRRLHTALARLEAAARRPAPAAASASAPAQGIADEDHHRLLLAHAALRDAVETAIARLDALVAVEER